MKLSNIKYDCQKPKPTLKVIKKIYPINIMSDDSQKDEIKDETHQLQDIEQEEIEDVEADEFEEDEDDDFEENEGEITQDQEKNKSK